ncbi:MAG TPA: hypothetical protein VFC83_03210 [Erysipelotrichaceae bacterium]|nr:hypothetical protein [Erysipelotrichaceae bacterium]
MAKNLLVTINNCELSINNDELRKSLTNIVSAEKVSKNSAWIVASEYTKIFDNELYEEDFESAKEFAEIMGVSKGLVSQYRKAYDFISVNEYFTANDISVGKAYMLSCIENLADFISWCDSNSLSITAMSDKCLRNTIKEWKKELEAIDVEESETVEEVDEVEEAENTTDIEDIKEMLKECSKEQLEELKNYIEGMLE